MTQCGLPVSLSRSVRTTSGPRHSLPWQKGGALQLQRRSMPDVARDVDNRELAGFKPVMSVMALPVVHAHPHIPRLGVLRTTSG